MKFIEFILGSFWHFIGFILILGTVAVIFYQLIIKGFEHRQVMKHGYPPAHYKFDQSGSYDQE